MVRAIARSWRFRRNRKAGIIWLFSFFCTYETVNFPFDWKQ
jgi:hypothetical protein